MKNKNLFHSILIISSLNILLSSGGICISSATITPPEIEWERTFGGPDSDDCAYSVQQTTDGGYIVAGCTGSYGAGLSNAWLIKTDSQGNELWSRTFGGSSDDYAYSVQQTMDGGYIMAGNTRSYSAGYCDAWLIKTDSQGNGLWSRPFGGLNCIIKKD